MRFRLLAFLVFVLWIAAQFGAGCGGLLTDAREEHDFIGCGLE